MSEFPSRTIASSLSRRRKLFFIFASIAIGLFASLLVGEILLHALGIVPAFNVVYRDNYRLCDNDLLQYELVPGSADRDTTINSDGLRDREYSIDKPEEVVRIIVIGDSVVFGFGLPQKEAFAKHLERMLNRTTPNGSVTFEVLNFGVVSYNATQVVEACRTKAMKYDPDLILYGYVLNDPHAFSLELESLTAMKDEAERSLKEVLSRGIARTLSHSRLFLMLQQARLKAPTPPRVYDLDPQHIAIKQGDLPEYLRELHRNDSTFRRTTDAFDALSDLADRQSAPVLVAVFPIRQGVPWDEYELADVHARVMKEARHRQLQAIDLAPALRSIQNALELQLYHDFLHPNISGHRAVAVALLEWLGESERFFAMGVSLERLADSQGEDARYAGILLRGDGD